MNTQLHTPGEQGQMPGVSADVLPDVLLSHMLFLGLNLKHILLVLSLQTTALLCIYTNQPPAKSPACHTLLYPADC